MSLQIKRLHLASLRGPDGLEWPVHGFVVTYPGGAVLVDHGVGGPPSVLIGDAAYTPRQYRGPADEDLPPGQAADPAAWRDSLQRIWSMEPAQVHFCHHTDVVHP